jgi:hypothetical protein
VGQCGPLVEAEVEPALVEVVAAQLGPSVGEVEAHIDAVLLEAAEAVADHETFAAVVRSTDHHHLTTPRPDAGVSGEWTEA